MCVCVCALSRLPWLFQLSDSVAVTSRMATRVQWFLLPALFKPSPPTPFSNSTPFYTFTISPSSSYFFFFSRCSLVQGLQATLQGRGLLMATVAGITTLLLPRQLSIALSFSLSSPSPLPTPPSAPRLMRGWYWGACVWREDVGALGCCLKSLQAGV